MEAPKAEPDPPLAPVKTHVLRPHHVIICALLILAFKGLGPEPKAFPATFLLDLIRLLLSETAEVRQPTPFKELLDSIRAASAPHTKMGDELAHALSLVPKHLATESAFSDFFMDIAQLTFEKDEDAVSVTGGPIFERRSWFGLYARRCRISFIKLTFGGVHKFIKDFRAWCNGDETAGYDLLETDRWNGLLITQTVADDRIFAQYYTYEAYERAAAAGDYEGATKNIRAFFEQRFSDTSDSGIRQYALLTLAQYHYSLGHMEECRRILNEAVVESRSNSDGPALRHATALLRRIPPTIPAPPAGETLQEAITRQVTESVVYGKPQPKYTEINADTSPLDLLFDVQQVITSAHPIRLAFEKLWQAVGVMDAAKDQVEVHWMQWQWHAVQAQIWRAAGVSSLGSAHECMVLAHTQPGGDDARLAAICSQAMSSVRRGRYDAAWAMMFDSDTWRGFNLRQYNVWAGQIWTMFAMRAGRRGQIKLYDEFLAPRRPSGATMQKRDFFTFWDGELLLPVKPKTVREQLQAVMAAKKDKRLIAALPHLFDALFTTEVTGMWELHRTAVILFTEAGLEMGMSTLAVKNIEEVMPRILVGEDVEQRAFALVTFARAVIAGGEGSSPSLERALTLLKRGRGDYALLDMYQQVGDVDYLTSIVLHNLKRMPERDEAIKRAFEAEEMRKKIAAEGADQDLVDAWELVCDIGVKIAGNV